MNRAAQANADGSRPTDDGIVTALEVAEMDLSGTQLMVLSACETGLGKETSGEGLLGLQRAFQVSGARTVVASLWQVDDEVRQQLMTRFYDHLWRQQRGPLEALRQAQLSILNGSTTVSRTRGPGAVDLTLVEGTRARAHPRLWAAWVLSGDPGDLGHLNALPAGGMPMAQSAVQQAAAEETPSASPGGLLVLVGGALVALLLLAWLLPRLYRRGAR